MFDIKMNIKETISDMKDTLGFMPLKKIPGKPFCFKDDMLVFNNNDNPNDTWDCTVKIEVKDLLSCSRVLPFNAKYGIMKVSIEQLVEPAFKDFMSFNDELYCTVNFAYVASIESSYRRTYIATEFNEWLVAAHYNIVMNGDTFPFIISITMKKR